MELKSIPLNLPNGVQFILGQGTFNILTVELIFQAVGSAIPHATFGVAMTEGSDHRLIRSSGNDDHLAALAAKLAYELGCGHIFLVLFEGAFPLQVLPSLRAVPTVLQIFAATGNPSIVLVAQLQEQGAILGVADGYSPLRRETSDERVSRRGAIRRFGYAEPD